jgi:hypothetical protein
MKKERQHMPPPPKQQPGRHQFEHQVPTQIHDPEQEMMVLARWFHRALKNPARFWGTVAAIAGGILALVLLSNMVSLGSSNTQEVWTKLEMAKTPSERVVLAEDNPQSPAAPWARLQAATEYYNQGFADLPNNLDVALPTLKKALDNFDAVSKTAPADSPEARAAALGKARTLEARNELSRAIDQYQYVEKTWPGTAEAAEAKGLAAALQKPDAASFYKDLYAFKPLKTTLPPLGSQNLDLPLLPSPPGLGSPAEASPTGGVPTIPLLPPPPPLPVTGKDATAKPSPSGPPAKSAPTGELPAAPFAEERATTKPGPALPASKEASKATRKDAEPATAKEKSKS